MGSMYSYRGKCEEVLLPGCGHCCLNCYHLVCDNQRHFTWSSASAASASAQSSPSNSGRGSPSGPSLPFPGKNKMPQLSYLTLVLITLAVYFLWMDVALYINLQQVPPTSPGATPTPENVSEYSYSPFYPISVKLLFQGPTIHYIDTPLAFWTVAYTNVARWMSANAVSVSGVITAFLAARLVVSDTLRVRQLGVVLFKVRDYIDSLDGMVARARRSQIHLTIEPGTMGYIFDGVCDGLGDVALLAALIVFVYRNHGGAKNTSNGFAYKRLDLLKGDEGPGILPVTASGYRNWSLLRRLLPTVFVMACLGAQTLLSSLIWNYSLIEYNDIFDSDVYVKTAEQAAVQNEMLKSPTMWMVVYFWRAFNPHSWVQFILLAILYNKIFEYVVAVQYLGFLPIAFIGLFSHLYAKYALSSILAAGPALGGAPTEVMASFST